MAHQETSNKLDVAVLAKQSALLFRFLSYLCLTLVKYGCVLVGLVFEASEYLSFNLKGSLGNPFWEGNLLLHVRT